MQFFTQNSLEFFAVITLFVELFFAENCTTPRKGGDQDK